jgi:putative tryptophan/tyrosine transport system substrate-binding protein
MVYRCADADLTRLPALADELVRLKPDVIVTFVIDGISSIQKATTTIPIVNPTLIFLEELGW